MIKASGRLAAAFNEQIGHELASSNAYVAIGAYFESETLPELARFFFNQADEERLHALKFVHFLTDVGVAVEIPAVPAPKSTFASAAEAVSLSLAGEQAITGQIYQLVDLAKEENHHAAQRFLDWFVVEQQEEESSMGSLLKVVERAGSVGLLHVEDYLARQSSLTATAP